MKIFIAIMFIVAIALVLTLSFMLTEGRITGLTYSCAVCCLGIACYLMGRQWK